MYALLNDKVFGPMSTAGPIQLCKGDHSFENKFGN